MLFNSWIFVGLFAATSVLYYGLPALGLSTRPALRFQIGILIIASLIFYGASDPRLILLLLGSVGVNTVAARRLLIATDQRVRMRTMQFAVTVNLLLLAFFKYAALFIGALLPASLDQGLIPVLRDIPLPIGISFYTFQAISLIVDLYRGDEITTVTLERARRAGSVVFASRVLLYISFFPQLVAGPIVQAHDFVDQIGLKRFGDVDLDFASRNIILGAFLKMVIADNIKEETVLLSAGQFEGATKLELILRALGYSAQIFSDFAGYSLLAIGLAAFLGYRLPINFNFPYVSASITEFWRRWHISLSTWLREYLYIPLGGNRKGAATTYRNLFIVMTLGGLWHGASWNFAVWGFAHGLILAGERLVSGGAPGEPRHLATRLVRVGATFTAVTALWLLFALPSFDATIDYFTTLASAPVGSPGTVPPQLLYTVPLLSIPVFVYHLWGAGVIRPRSLPAGWSSAPSAWLRPAVAGVLLFFVISNSGTPGAFIYFQF